MAITLESATTEIISSENTSQTVSFSHSGNLLVVALSSVFKTVAPNSVTWNGLAMSQEGGITSPNEKSKSELYTLYNPDQGTHNLVIEGTDVFVGVVTLYSFSGANRNPIADIQTQTGTTGQNPNLAVNSGNENFVIEVVSGDVGISTLTFGGGQTSRGNNLFATANCLGYGGGSSKVGASTMSGTWDVASTSWAHLAVSLRGVIPLKIGMNSRLVDNDFFQWIIKRR